MLGWMVGRLVSFWDCSLRQLQLLLLLLLDFVGVLILLFSSFNMIIRPWPRGMRSRILQPH